MKPSVATLLLTILLLGTACGGKDSPPPPPAAQELTEAEIAEVNPFKGEASAIAEGKRLFAIKCSPCHGPDGTGGAEAPDLTDGVTIYSGTDRAVFKIIYSGTGKGMPTWKAELGPESIWKVMAYVESLRQR